MANTKALIFALRSSPLDGIIEKVVGILTGIDNTDAGAVDRSLKRTLEDTDTGEERDVTIIGGGFRGMQRALAEAARSSSSVATIQELVVEGRRSWRPKCSTYHGKGKRPLTKFSNAHNACDETQEGDCIEIIMTAEGLEIPDPIIATRSPASDLKWWFGSNALDEDLLREPDFEDKDLRTAIVHGIADLKALRGELAGLVRYAQRTPYNLICDKVAHHRTDKLLSITPQRVSRWDRERLEYFCGDLRSELIYFIIEAEDLKARIVRRKARLAEKGNEFELANLLVQGYHDEVYAIWKKQEAGKEEGIRIA